MKVGVIVAMDCEFAALSSAGNDFPGKILVPALSGMGKVNAARCATEMILRERPDCIINTGLAGAVAEGIGLGDAVVAERVAYHDVWCGEGNEPGAVQGLPRFFDADGSILTAAREAASSFEGKVHFGLECCGDQFFISLDEDRRICGLYPDVLACDMESGAVAQVCRHYGVPFICCRIVSDLHTSHERQKESYNNSIASLCGRSFEFISKLITKL